MVIAGDSNQALPKDQPGMADHSIDNAMRLNVARDVQQNVLYNQLHQYPNLSYL